MKVHPAAELFPMIPAGSEDFNSLVESIATEGLRDPIVMHDGVLVDGRNRLAACKAANVDPRFVQWRDVAKGDDLTGWIFAKNYHRRHLSPDQKVAVHAAFNRYELEERAAKAKLAASFTSEKAKAAAGKRHHAVDPKSDPPHKTDVSVKNARSTAGKIAAAAGVSRHKAAQAVALDKAAQTNPDAKAAQEAVIAGTMKLPEAIKKVVKPKKAAAAKPAKPLADIFASRWRKFMDYFPACDHPAVRELIKSELGKH
jgi:ParB-like chromosome segregation protein Spo0J